MNKSRLIGLIMIDSFIVTISVYLSHFFLQPSYTELDNMILTSSIILLLSHHVFSYFFGIYRWAWKYVSIEELLGMIIVITLSVLTVMLVQVTVFNNLYERALSITWMLHVIMLGGIRYIWRYYNTYRVSLSPVFSKYTHTEQKRTLIIGAGSAGRMLVKQLKNNDQSELLPIAFLDDDIKNRKLTISGLPVEGFIEEVEDVVKRKQIEHIVIAIPSADKETLTRIVSMAKMASENVQILPMIEDIASGQLSVKQIRDVKIEDLLGREPVKLDIENIAQKIQNQTVLVTGAGGSIGSEICRQLCKFNPEKIILLGHGENSIYNIELELKNEYTTINFPTEIADIQDRDRMFSVFEKHKPSFVFHAAAHKHVPLMERNPAEAVKNNIIGTKNVADASDAFSVDTFVLISSDKAVNPTNVMGSTKRVAEMLIQDLNKKSPTKFAAVRFGNVLGSRGSVIPIFTKQIKNGGPITVTHPDMTRYFMTIPEASRLVIQAASLAKGGEIFVLDMGEPVKIVDLAKNLIRLSGLSIDEVGIEFSGIRPGEKMYEELLNKSEVHNEQIYPKIYVGRATTTSEQLKEVYRIIKSYDHYQELTQDLIDLANNKQKEQHLQLIHQ